MSIEDFILNNMRVNGKFCRKNTRRVNIRKSTRRRRRREDHIKHTAVVLIHQGKTQMMIQTTLVIGNYYTSR